MRERTPTPSYRQLIFSDLARYRNGLTPSWRAVALPALTNPGLLTSLVLRGQQRVYASGHVRSAAFLRTVALMTRQHRSADPVRLIRNARPTRTLRSPWSLNR